MTRVLLVGKDWQARALLRAQLIEEGLEVEAHETVRDALQSLAVTDLMPGLFIADVTASDDATEEIDQLANWTRQFPIWIIASRSVIMDRTLKGRGFEIILFRPIDISELVEQIKRRLAA